MSPDPTVTAAPAEVDPTRTLCGWVKAYHPSGLLVTLPVTAPGLDPHELLDCVSRMVEAGWLVTAPGLDEGEQKFDAEAVSRRSKGNQDGSETPVIDLYEHGNEYRSLAVYLNEDADVAAFEYAAGVRLNDIPLFPGQAPIQRGVSRQTDRLVVTVPRPFGVVCKPNPKYDANETDVKKKKPRRFFVRWAKAAPGGDPSELLSPPECEQVLDLLAQTKSDQAAFHTWVAEMAPRGEVRSVHDIPRVKLARVLDALTRKKNGGGK